MVDINLVTKDYHQSRTFSFSKALALFFLILLILIGFYGWLYFNNNSMAKNIAETNSKYEAEYQGLIAGDAKIIMDFQNRLERSRQLLGEKDYSVNSLLEIEKTIVSGAYINSYDYNKEANAIQITGVAENLDILAGQVLSFKNDKFFSEVSPGRASINSDGKIEFDINLKINNL